MRDLKIFTDDIEDKAREQIDLLLDQEPFKDCKIRIMPDVHAGAGCVIGFTGNLGDKVIPNVVGVDIGCGMLCVELGHVDIDLEKLDKIIRERVPSGMNVHSNIIHSFDLSVLNCFKDLKNKDKWLEKSLGTLGGGNHFIEIDIDSMGNKYLIIHTGSRNLGKQVAEIYQNLAIKYCSYDEEMKLERTQTIQKLKEEHRESEIEDELKAITEKYKDKTKLPKELCYLEGEDRKRYLDDMDTCQRFAHFNRLWIATIILEGLYGINNVTLVSRFEDVELAKRCNVSMTFPYFETIHNYISFTDNIIRKGAISAHKNEIVLIPMNMRDGCIIARGKGCDEWNNSAPHGAGRLMSRAKARQAINLEDYKASMSDIFSTSINMDTIDEAPMVYKPMEEIISKIGDTVEIIDIIKPIYNFKASE